MRIPHRDDLLWPTLRALEDRGGSASIGELSEDVARSLTLSDDVLDVPHGEGPQTEIDYRAAWARTSLKWIGAITNTSRGVWTITKAGRRISSEEMVRSLAREERRRRFPPKSAQKEPKAKRRKDGGANEGGDWKADLLSIIRKITPEAFERLCQLILRESGFTKVEVTGRSGDGGIDGAGVLRVQLISFHVRFQCKRYRDSVGASAIRDFRGAMVGRADKGLFMTTGRFTRDAEREAVRDGAPAIDLVDGSAICDLLKDLDLGVNTRMVEKTELLPEFFNDL